MTKIVRRTWRQTLRIALLAGMTATNFHLSRRANDQKIVADRYRGKQFQQEFLAFLRAKVDAQSEALEA